MPLLACKKHSIMQRHPALFLCALLLACLITACAPPPSSLNPTSTPNNHAEEQKTCPTLAHSLYAVQGQILYTAISAPQHPLRPGEQYNNVSYKVSLVAFNTRDGQMLWSHSLAENVPYTLSIVTDVQLINHLIYIDTGSVFAADSGDGHLVWQHKGIVGYAGINMDVCVGRLYRIDEKGNIIALRASDGAQLWSSTIKNLTYYVSFAFTNQGVFIIDRAGTNSVHYSLLTALGGANGKVLWTHTYKKTSSSEVASITTDGRALYVINSPVILTLDPTTGKTLRTLPIPNGSFFGTMRDHTLFLSSPNYDASTLTAIDIHTGKQLWENKASLSDKGTNIRYFAALNSQDLYINTLLMDKGNDHFCALAGDTGKERWCINNLMPEVFIITGTYLVATSDTAVFLSAGPSSSTNYMQTIYALNKKDGSVLWKTQPALSSIPSKNQSALSEIVFDCDGL